MSKTTKTKHTEPEYATSVDVSQIYEDRSQDYQKKSGQENNPKGVFARFSEFVSGIASAVKSLLTSSLGSRTSQQGIDFNSNVSGTLGNNKTRGLGGVARHNQPEVNIPASYEPDTKVIKESISKIIPVIESALKDTNLTPEVRQAAQQVKQSADLEKSGYNLDAFKEAVGKLHDKSSVFENNPGNNNTAYNLACFSGTVSKALTGVSLNSAPNAAYALSGEGGVNMSGRASQISAAIKNFETGGVGKHAQKQESEKAQSQSKGTGVSV